MGAGRAPIPARSRRRGRSRGSWCGRHRCDRRRASGGPWAWDGRGALASVFKGAEVDVWEDPTPAEPDAFLGWLARQTARELPLAALMGR